jgi:hypothetical protein
MSESKRKVCGWQIYAALLGIIAWLALLQSIDYIRQYGWLKLYSSASGYVIGFITALAGWLFWEILQGRGKKFLDDQPALRWISIVQLCAIFIFGLAGFFKSIWGTNDWTFSLAYFIGATVVGKGLMPFLECLQPDY